MHPEVLTKAGAALLPTLGRFQGFYLAGGTALALQIGHRISVDFDLFSNEPIERTLLHGVRRAFGAGAEIVPLVNNSDELTATVNGVKITFLRYPFPVLDGFVRYDGLSLLSVREIAATKAYTIGRRGSFKDYVDLYFIVSQGHASLPNIIANAEEKFGTDFNSRLFLEQLVYLEDLDTTEVQFVKEPATAEEIRSFFECRIRALADQL